MAVAAQRYESGKRLYETGDRKGAIEEFKASYRFYPSARTLYALGQVQREEGLLEDALHSFKQCVARAPQNAAYLGDAQKLLDQLTTAVEEKKRAQSAPPVGVTPNSTSTPNTPNVATGTQTITTVAPATPWYRRPEGWATLGAGVVVVAVGGGLLGQSANLQNQAANATTVIQQRQLLSDSTNYQNAGIGLAVVGGAAVVAGVIIIGVEAGQAKARRTARVRGVGRLAFIGGAP
jgi:tetratricopeptide (TPR) repeat protein